MSKTRQRLIMDLNANESLSNSLVQTTDSKLRFVRQMIDQLTMLEIVLIKNIEHMEEQYWKEFNL